MVIGIIHLVNPGRIGRVQHTDRVIRLRTPLDFQTLRSSRARGNVPDKHPLVKGNCGRQRPANHLIEKCLVDAHGHVQLRLTGDQQSLPLDLRVRLWSSFLDVILIDRPQDLIQTVCVIGAVRGDRDTKDRPALPRVVNPHLQDRVAFLTVIKGKPDIAILFTRLAVVARLTEASQHFRRQRRDFVLHRCSPGHSSFAKKRI